MPRSIRNSTPVLPLLLCPLAAAACAPAEMEPDTSSAPQAITSACESRIESHGDPNTGQSWSTVWYCENDHGATMYLGTNNSTPVAYMDSTSSWFACYRRGEMHSGGNNVWYYSQGDRAAPGWSGRQAWGFMPAANVWTPTDPYRGIPECHPDMAQTRLSVSDPNTGASWTTVWMGTHTGGTPLYKDANANTVVGYLDSTSSWFTCYVHGVTHGGANDVWYYTQGDRSAPGWSARSPPCPRCLATARCFAPAAVRRYGGSPAADGRRSPALRAPRSWTSRPRRSRPFRSRSAISPAAS